MLAANRAALAFNIARWLIHDQRNPVQMLSLLPDLVDPDTGALDLTARGALSGAVDRLHESTNLLDELLRQPPPFHEPGPVELASVLDYVSRLGVRPRMGVSIRVEPLPVGLPAVRGLEYWITHVVLNLVLNAVEAMAEREAGDVAVRVELAGDLVRLTVHDDGPGIPEAVRPRLFEPYVSTKRYRPLVAGLGLAVSRMLAESMGGTVRVSSTGPAGTVVEATIGVWKR